MKNCENGFSVSLLTPAGDNADHHGQGCAASILGSPDDTAEDQLKKFVRLRPAEIRTWQTVLPTSKVRLGPVCLYGEYFSLGYMLDEVSHLPEVEGTMAKGRITASPIQIRIRK